MSDKNVKSPLWRWPELSAGLCRAAQAGPDVAGVKVDSRQVQPGDLFIALPGDPGPRFNPSYRSDVDGHDYVASAAAQGAVGAMVHKPRDQLDIASEFPLLPVGDTYDGLWALGRLARARLSGDVVAVTGSSGKTTAKHFFSAALGAYAPPGSFNNHIGVPLALANAPADSAASVFEIGTNHPGEIAPLAAMVDAQVAVLLNVHNAHIENFENWEALKEEKVSIFNALTDKSKAISEDELRLGFGLTFGMSDAADARVAGLEGDRARIDCLGQKVSARVPGGGMHRAKTVAATLLVCHLLGRDLASACELDGSLVPRGRGNIIQAGGVTLIDDSYNANPASMAASLDGFLTLEGGLERRIAVIGEMLELGDEAKDAHMSLAPLLEQMDGVFCVGEGTRVLAHALGQPWSAAVDEALLADVAMACTPGSGVLVKGSNRVFWAQSFVERLIEKIEKD